MAGYLSETDFVMVEEGFSTRDLLEELTLGASQATAGDVAAFFVADLGAVVRKHFCLLKCLPRIRPFYTVKCNSSPGVLKVLAELGLGFSCANKAEMELVQRIGVPASKIVYANPCKQIAQIKYAAKHGVRLLSFDNEVELAKVVKSHPSAKMVLCIATDDSHSLSHLSFKFGASLKSCRHLLENAKRSHVEVVGVSFHVGSGCPDLHAYTQSIADARLVFEMGAELGHRMHILDLGGGFPGLEGAKVRFEEIATVINSALDLYFPEGCGVDILARLGRYYVTSAFTLAVSIIAKKEVLLDQPGREEETGSTPKTIVYHLGEGVYGIFNSVLFDNTCPTPILQKVNKGTGMAKEGKENQTPCCIFESPGLCFCGPLSGGNLSVSPAPGLLFTLSVFLFSSLFPPCLVFQDPLKCQLLLVALLLFLPFISHRQKEHSCPRCPCHDLIISSFHCRVVKCGFLWLMGVSLLDVRRNLVFHCHALALPAFLWFPTFYCTKKGPGAPGHTAGSGYFPGPAPLHTLLACRWNS
ncbi:antizyme inhibitor 2 isoform X1 [Vulpes vulpes]|uniref:Antizyme inhibitor 2 isoform X1 n=2 Tax=Vulpes vulpes TaxID=9627 RepID=A0ABM4ZV56_VULVU